MIEIGSHKLKYGVVLAPMAGFTDYAMRLIAKKYGAELTYTEMISAKAIEFGDRKTHALAKIYGEEERVALQLFGNDADIMARSAYKMQNIAERGDGISPVMIDINMGCPVHKIFSNGEGSALMKNPELIYKIVKATKENIDLPLGVKLRAGVDEASRNAVSCALAAEEAGANIVTVHGRTRAQMYQGKSDLEIIKNVKQALHIPVIGNGDIVDAQSALDMLSYTGADGVMIGRGAIGNPFIFEEIISVLSGKPMREIPYEERIDTALLQLSLAIKDKGENIAVRESRKQISLYFKGWRGAAELRANINKAETYAEVRDLILALGKD